MVCVYCALEKIPYQMLRQRETHAVVQNQWKPVGKATIDRVRRKSSTADKSKATRRERVLTTQELDRLKKEVDQCKEKLEGIRGEVGKTREALGVQRGESQSGFFIGRKIRRT